MSPCFSSEFSGGTGSGIRIAVVDTGLDSTHGAIHFPANGVTITHHGMDYGIEPGTTDTIGHGTAVCNCIKRVAKDVDLFVVNAFDDTDQIDVERLTYALNYISDNVPCDIVHISSGITDFTTVSPLHEACKKLVDQGRIVVSAFDNYGAISYPAAFPEVIGVDMSIACSNMLEYEYVESDLVNVRAQGVSLRVPWAGHTYRIVTGTSFSSAFITGIIAIFLQYGYRRLDDIRKQLKKYAVIQHTPSYYEETGRPFIIHEAIALPFNKEMHLLAAKSLQTDFVIRDFFTYKYTGQVHKRISEVLHQSVDQDYMLKNVDTIPWEEAFDTVIVGHLGNLSRLVKKNLKAEILENCLIYRKNLYMLDYDEVDDTVLQRFREKGLQIFCPGYDVKNLPKGIFGRMHVISTPIVGVFGTSSIQGKFNLQLELKRLFCSRGFTVGHLSTEATGFLLGADEVFPFGYHSTVTVSGIDAVIAINNLLHKIEENTHPDIIIAGSQSLSVQSSSGNIGAYPCAQTELLFALDADVIILCVNYTDEISYIKRTIRFLEAANESKVLAAVLFPCIRRDVYSYLDNHMSPISDIDLQRKKEELCQNLSLEVYAQNSSDDMEALFQSILQYFS